MSLMKPGMPSGLQGEIARNSTKSLLAEELLGIVAQGRDDGSGTAATAADWILDRTRRSAAQDTRDRHELP